MQSVLTRDINAQTCYSGLRTLLARLAGTSICLSLSAAMGVSHVKSRVPTKKMTTNYWWKSLLLSFLGSVVRGTSTGKREGCGEQIVPLPVPLPILLSHENHSFGLLCRGGDLRIEHEIEMYGLKKKFYYENLQIYTKVEYSELPWTHHLTSTVINILPVLFHLFLLQLLLKCSCGDILKQILAIMPFHV